MEEIVPARKHSRNYLARFGQGIASHPLLLILIAHTIFSIGIWNSRDGYGEDSGSFLAAYSGQASHLHGASLYGNLAVFIVTHITPDPVMSATLLKYLSSLVATAGLYLTLNCFSAFLRQGAIILASLVWISCSLNAPYLQSTSSSLFTFGVMLFGMQFLLRRESLFNILAFYSLGLLAASIRPEYFLPLAFITLVFLATWIWKWTHRIKPSRGRSTVWFSGILLFLAFSGFALLVEKPPAWIAKKTKIVNAYLLFSFGQCYADYYHRTHPELIFSPMTEYREILATQFNNPPTLWAAIKDHPAKALGYFWHNSLDNLGNIPGALLGFRQHHEFLRRGVMYWAVITVLITGGALSIGRLFQSRLHCEWAGILSGLATPSSGVRKVVFLLMLAAACLISIPLLVGTPRYFIYLAPLFYLGLAVCADSILQTVNLARFEPAIIAAACLGICSPNYLQPRPSYDYDAARSLIPLVRTNPLIAAWWADPEVAFGFRGQARAVNVGNRLFQEEVANGSVDILMLDGNFRGTKLWADHRDFYEELEREPEKFGFKKLTGINAGRFSIYYRPKS